MLPQQFKKYAEMILAASHGDPFSFLGMHESGKGWVAIRAYLPHAETVHVVDTATGKAVAELPEVHEGGIFAGPVDGSRGRFPYRLRITTADGESEIEDPYRFPPVLGAEPMRMEGVDGVGFAVWAPNAARVSVVGDFNTWDGRRHPMRFRDQCGVWEIFIPGIGEGELYKFEIRAKNGDVLPLKQDPFAVFCEQAPGTAAIVYDLTKSGPTTRGWRTGARPSPATRRSPSTRCISARGAGPTTATGDT